MEKKSSFFVEILDLSLEKLSAAFANIQFEVYVFIYLTTLKTTLASSFFYDWREHDKKGSQLLGCSLVRWSSKHFSANSRQIAEGQEEELKEKKQ